MLTPGHARPPPGAFTTRSPESHCQGTDERPRVIRRSDRRFSGRAQFGGSPEAQLAMVTPGSNEPLYSGRGRFFVAVWVGGDGSCGRGLVLLW